MEALFFGSYEHQIDDKGRFRIPAKFKKGLETYPEKTYSFVRGLSGSICLFPDSVLEETLSSLADERVSEANPISLMVFSSIYPAEEDGQGRVTLPAKLKQIAGIKKDIVTVGRGRRLEIWAAEKYREVTENVDYDSELKKLGILGEAACDAKLFSYPRNAGRVYGKSCPEKRRHILRRHRGRRRAFLRNIKTYEPGRQADCNRPRRRGVGSGERKARSFRRQVFSS